MNDPAHTYRRRISLTWTGGLIAAFACAIWAFRLPKIANPVTAKLSVLEEPSENAAADDQINPLDRRAFTAKLWNAPPPSDPEDDARKAEAPPPPPTPINLQLIGITEHSGVRTAALYDPRSDTLHFVSDGQQISRHTVTTLTTEYVELDDGRTTRRLELRPDSGGPS